MYTDTELAAIDRAAERRIAAEEFRERHPELFVPAATALHPLFEGVLNAAATAQRVIAAACVLTEDECAAVDDTAGLLTSDEPFKFTPPQRGARADFEDAYRAGELRGLPTAFGAL